MLSFKQQQVLEAHFTCESVREIARLVGVAPSTVIAWRKKQEFIQVLEEQRKEYENIWKRKLARLAVKSLKNLEKFLDNGSENSTHKVNDIFLKSKALDDSDEIKRRIAELEKIAKLQTQEKQTQEKEKAEVETNESVNFAKI